MTKIRLAALAAPLLLALGCAATAPVGVTATGSPAPSASPSASPAASPAASEEPTRRSGVTAK